METLSFLHQSKKKLSVNFIPYIAHRNVFEKMLLVRAIGYVPIGIQCQCFWKQLGHFIMWFTYFASYLSLSIYIINALSIGIPFLSSPPGL